MSYELRRRIATLAMSKPEGSAARRKLMTILAATKETFYTDAGKKFKIRTLDFVKWLQAKGVKPGAELGAIIRGDQPIPASWTKDTVRIRGYHGAPDRNVTLADLGATGPAVRPPRPPRKKKKKPGPMWDRVVKAIWKEVGSPDASSAADVFWNNPEHDEDSITQVFAQMSGDVGTNWRYSLYGTHEKAWNELEQAFKNGEVAYDWYEDDDLDDYRQRMRDLYADAWYTSMEKGWEEIRRDAKELARLKADRPS